MFRVKLNAFMKLQNVKTMQTILSIEAQNPRYPVSSCIEKLYLSTSFL